MTVVFVVMSKNIMEQRTNIKFCFKFGKKFTETYKFKKKFMVMIV